MSFFVGVPFNALVVTLPQRFQALDALSPLDAGIRLLPYTAVSPVCSVVANAAASKGRVPLVYLLLLGAICQLVGVILLSTLNSIDFPSAGLGYEAVAGAGVGITFSILVLGTPFTVEPRNIGKCTRQGQCIHSDVSAQLWRQGLSFSCVFSEAPSGSPSHQVS